MLLLRTSIVAHLAFAALIATATDSFAQAEQSAFAKSEIGRIKNQAVGNSYTSAAVTRQVVNSTQAFVGIQGIGEGRVAVSSLLSSTPAATPRKAASFNSFGSLSNSNKPFSSVSSSPTISPYLNLFRENLDDNTDNYNTLVRPQLQQQQINQNFQREAQAITRHVQSLSAKPAFNPVGSEQYMPTGHPTGFMHYSHFYPSASTRRPSQ